MNMSMWPFGVKVAGIYKWRSVMDVRPFDVCL